MDLNSDLPKEEIALTSIETAEALQVTVDTLRNWELNGLIIVCNHGKKNAISGCI